MVESDRPIYSATQGATEPVANCESGGGEEFGFVIAAVLRQAQDERGFWVLVFYTLGQAPLSRSS